MGLDITAYRKLEIVEKPEFDRDGELKNWKSNWNPGISMEWSERHFPGRGEGIDPQKVYTWKEELNFKAGSYGSYNWWRSKLKEFKGERAFQELIDFADNEGVIGFVISKKLANDFDKYKEDAVGFSKTLGENAEYWLESYHNWRMAFEMASDNGAVSFH